MVSNAAPDSARWPRWIRCQSVMHPSSAEYWHMGAITMRLASSRSPIRRGAKSLARVIDDPFAGERGPAFFVSGRTAQTRQTAKGFGTLRAYDRSAKLFRDHAGKG